MTSAQEIVREIDDVTTMNASYSTNTTAGATPDMADIYKWLHGEVIVLIDEPQSLALVILYCISFTFGFVGNVFVIYVVAASRNLRSSSFNFFLVNLAVCDLMVVCFCMPFTVAMIAYSDWVYGAAWCKLMNFLQGVAVISSILTLTVISRRRFYAIQQPMKALRSKSKRGAGKCIFGIYVASAVAALPLILMSSSVSHDVSGFVWHECREVWPAAQWRWLYNFFILFRLFCPYFMGI